MNTAQRSGTFVVFEGIDGSGKSTQLAAVAEALRAEGFNVVTTREPGGSELAEKIRALVLDPDNDVDDVTEAYLFAAARASHVRARIKPALDDGAVVLCDRFIASSVAYQGAGRGLGEEFIARLNEAAVDGVEPDLTVVLDIDPAVGARRRAARATSAGAGDTAGAGTNTDGGVDRIEQAPDEFQYVLRRAFLEQVEQAAQAEQDAQAENAGQRGGSVVVDAAQESSSLTQEILGVIRPVIA